MTIRGHALSTTAAAAVLTATALTAAAPPIAAQGETLIGEHADARIAVVAAEQVAGAEPVAGQRLADISCRILGDFFDKC